MTYTPRPGDFFVERSDGLIGLAIRVVTGSRYSHAGILLDDAGTTIETFYDGGAAYGDAYDGIDTTWSECDLTDEQRDRIVAAARSLIGTPYSWVDVLCVGLAKVFGIHVPESVRKRLRRRNNLMCSQLVDTAYLMAGVHLFDDGRVPGDVSPGDLGDIIANGSKIPVR